MKLNAFYHLQIQLVKFSVNLLCISALCKEEDLLLTKNIMDSTMALTAKESRHFCNIQKK